MHHSTVDLQTRGDRMRRLRYYIAAITWRALDIVIDELFWLIGDLSAWALNKADAAEARYRRGQ